MYANATGQPRLLRDRCKALLEPELRPCPPVAAPDRSRSLLLQTRVCRGVSSSPGASGPLTRRNTPAPHPLLVRPSQCASCHLPFRAAPARDHRTPPLGPGRPASAPRFAQQKRAQAKRSCQPTASRAQPSQAVKNESDQSQTARADRPQQAFLILYRLCVVRRSNGPRRWSSGSSSPPGLSA